MMIHSLEDASGTIYIVDECGSPGKERMCGLSTIEYQ